MSNDPSSDPSSTDPSSTDPSARNDTAASTARGSDMTNQPSTNDTTATAVQAPAHPAPSGPYVPTIITGLVVLTVAALIGIARLTEIDVDYGLVLPVGMIAAGVLLLLGAALAVLTSRRRR